MKRGNMMNDVKVKLAYVSNPNMAQYEGCEGVLKQNNKGGWSFIMNNGKTISTSRIAPNTTLGDFNHPSCKEFSFKTASGSTYVFDVCNREKLFDGCFRKDNQYQSYDTEKQEWGFEK